MLRKIFILITISFLISPISLAQETKPEPVSYQISTGTGHYDHSYFTAILKGMVLKRETVMAIFKNMGPQLGTRIRPSNTVGRGYDINYIPYSIIMDDFRGFITANKYYFMNLARVNPSKLSKNEQLAYWLNLRNSMVLDLIFEHYPVKPKEMENLVMGQAWKAPRITVNGQEFSISDIEALVTQGWPDPNVLYGFFYGTQNSPFIMDVAFSGDQVYSLLEDNARAYLNASGTLKISRKTLALPAVFDWHKGVYKADLKILLNHLEGFLDGSRKTKMEKYSPRVLAFNSNWKINDIPTQIVGTGNDRLFVYGNANGCNMGPQTGEGCTFGVVIEDSNLATRFPETRR